MEQYFSDVKRVEIDVDPKLLTVMYFEEPGDPSPKFVRGDVEIKMTFTSILSWWETTETLWASYLASVTVPPLKCGVETARSLNADYLCNKHP